MNNDYRPPACLVSFYVTRNTFTINIGLTWYNRNRLVSRLSCTTAVTLVRYGHNRDACQSEGDEWNVCIDALIASIKERLTASLCDSDESKNVLLSFVVTNTSMQIMKNIYRMVNQEIRNEAELRFCIGDPVLCAICDAWKYRAKLEESVKNQTKLSAPLQPESSSDAPSTSMAAPQLTSIPLGVYLSNHRSEQS